MILTRRTIFRWLGIGVIAPFLPAAAQRYFAFNDEIVPSDGVRPMGPWTYVDSGKPAEAWNGCAYGPNGEIVYTRTRAEHRAICELEYSEPLPPSFHRGGVDPDVMAKKLAEEEARFLADRERFRAEEGWKMA